MGFVKHGTGEILPSEEDTQPGRGQVPDEFDQTEHVAAQTYDSPEHQAQQRQQRDQ